MEAAKARPSLRLEELVEEVSERLQVERHEAARSLYTLSKEGKLRIEDPKPPDGVFGYMRSTYSFWFWSLLTLVALSVATVYLFPQVPPYIYLRYVVGSLFVLYLPGYSLIEALYPKEDDLVPLERLALSMGLNLVLVPLVGLVLNYTPWGLRLDPIFTSLALLTAALALVAVVRRFAYFRLRIETVTSTGSGRRGGPRRSVG